MNLESIERSMKELVESMNEGLETIKGYRLNMEENCKKAHEEFNLTLDEHVKKIDNNKNEVEETANEIDSLFDDIDGLFDDLK